MTRRDGAADDAESLLRRFAADIGQVLPLTALWAHGSLALGDFVPGRSDLDLVAITAAPVTAAQRAGLQRAHEALLSQVPLADGRHCSYVVNGEHDDSARPHLTWAFGELFERPVSPVTRRELCQGGRSLLGPAPAAIVPAVADAELADYIRGYLRDYWHPRTGRPELWLRDIWVDLGMLTLARDESRCTRGGSSPRKRHWTSSPAWARPPTSSVTSATAGTAPCRPPPVTGWPAGQSWPGPTSASASSKLSACDADQDPALPAIADLSRPFRAAREEPG
ncbi:MAG TPA: nucleotidyltransferase domain-containing protein [Streptosporangiaceae bacterium]